MSVSDQIDMSALQSRHRDRCFQRMRLMTAHAAKFFTLDKVNHSGCCRPATDNADGRAALGHTNRQCRRLLPRYRESGPLGMANRRRRKPSNNQLPDGLAQYALNIIRERYSDFGPTLVCEKLAELHNVHLSKETVCSLMIKASLWIPRKQRAPKIQQPRYRRTCCGEPAITGSRTVRPPVPHWSTSTMRRAA